MQSRSRNLFASLLLFVAPAVMAAPYGWHDSSSTSSLDGWTCSADNFNQALTINVYDQFGYVGPGTAGNFRGDLGQAGVCGGTSNHGFHYDLSQSSRNLRDGQTHSFSVYAADPITGRNYLLSGSPQSVFMPAQPATLPYGWLDFTNTTGASGWTCDVDNTNAALTIQITDQYGVVGTATANAYRGDLGGVCPGNLYHGFNVVWSQFSRDIRDGLSHYIRAYAFDSQTGQQVELSGSGHDVFFQLTGTMQTLAAPSCGILFSTGEQYRDPDGVGRGRNGIVRDNWFMLTRWQGAREMDFVDHVVGYDVGQFTGLHTTNQRGVYPEQSAGSAAVQNSCYTSGMLLNSWTSPHRPVVGGWADDMLGYAFSGDVRPFTLNGRETTLVISANVVVPGFFQYRFFPDRGPPPTAQVGFFAYLRDKRPDHQSAPPIAVLAMTHMSNVDDSWPGGGGWDYQATDPNPYSNETTSYTYATSHFPNWFPASQVGNGVCYVSVPINLAENATDRHRITVVDADTAKWHSALTSYNTDLSKPMESYRVRITPDNLRNIVARVNQNCPYAINSAGPYSTNAADWALEYAGIIAETAIPTDQTLASGSHYDNSWSDWPGAGNYSDHSHDQVALSVRIDSPTISRYVP